MTKISVVGGGLAGVEASLQLAVRGFDVELYEMKKIEKSPAHSLNTLCELVCSNSLKSTKFDSAGGLLKQEMNTLGCFTLNKAMECSVPAGGALAVDREKFSIEMTKLVEENEKICVIDKIVDDIPNGPCIIATGPLTHNNLANKIKEKFECTYFFDAASPIITKDSIDMNIVYRASRYGEIGEGDYLNCPMEKDEYFAFYNELINANSASLHEFDKMKVFESCMPVEVMAKRGENTLTFGPLRPVGLINPKTGKRPFAVVQLRQEDLAGECYNLVGFQTNLSFPEQKRVFSMIPGLNNAEFVRYGVMHRNTFINSPKYLNEYFACKEDEDLFFAGQITGVEGYVESIASGMMAGINMARKFLGKELNPLPKESILGSLCDYIAHYNGKDFQPMNANFGIITPLENKIRDKKERYLALSQRSIDILKCDLSKYI